MFDATPFLFARNRLALLAVMALLALGLAIRLYDLTDLPLDFHPTRQLLSELKARGMYYQGSSALPDWQRRMAVQQWKGRAEVEPEVFEALVAFTYRFTGVQLWVARVYSSIFWVAGAFFLFLLVHDLVSPDGAVAACYFALPFAVISILHRMSDDYLLIASGGWCGVKCTGLDLGDPGGLSAARHICQVRVPSLSLGLLSGGPGAFVRLMQPQIR
jgi:hypothetical protein